MQSLPTDDPQSEKLINVLMRLFARQDVNILAKSGGGNSVVYCVAAGGEKYAVKSYPPYAPGKRDRLASEVLVYQFLNQNQIASVPRLINFSEVDRLLVMEWIEGVTPETYTLNDIEQAIDFIEAIAALNHEPAAKEIPLAAEACLSLATLINQVTSRYERLEVNADHEPMLNDFLVNEFLPVFADCRQRAREGYMQARMNTELDLANDKRSLIPADFGFHNAMRDAAGRLHFFDFDYFGWDDPVKLLADILWHPKMQLNADEQHRFISGLTYVYRDDQTFAARFKLSLPLYGLRWTLIFLNEFLPEFWQNRQHASVHASHAEAKIKQLNRARATLQHVKNIGSQYAFITETSI
jgi:hypothetical protein